MRTVVSLFMFARPATARRGGRRGCARCRGMSGCRCAASAPATTDRCAGRRTTTRRTAARTTGRRRSTRRACRRECRHDRSTWHACRVTAITTARVAELCGRSVGVLLTGARNVLGPGAAIPVAQVEATSRVGVPTRGNSRCRGCCRLIRRSRDRRHRGRELASARVQLPSQRARRPGLLVVSGVKAVVVRRGRRQGSDCGGGLTSRLKKAVTSLAVVTMPTTLQPSADFSVSVAARAAGSFDDELTVPNSNMARRVSRSQPARTS